MKKIERDFKIQTLGVPRIPSPLTVGYFKSDRERILSDISVMVRNDLSFRPR
jgi:hypothetical protein